jgi:hypothetical protein
MIFGGMILVLAGIAAASMIFMQHTSEKKPLLQSAPVAANTGS